jgi:hypothetical protein
MKPALTCFPLYLVVAAAMFLGATTINCQSVDSTPTIHFSNVPITTAIESLARLSNLNYKIDPKLFDLPGSSTTKGIPEPIVTFVETNVTAEYALTQLLKEHGLVMVQNKFTAITLITSTNHVANVVDASLLVSTNTTAQMTSSPIPVIQFFDVPLDEVLKRLIEQGHINAVLDPKVSDYADPSDNKLHPTPAVSLRWNNLTANQAIVALCEIYDLVIVKDAATGVVSIKLKD